MRWWQQLKNIYHYFQARAWQLWYGYPDRRLAIYGITGTNGKTTTCYLLCSILQQQYGVEHVGMLSTVTFRLGEHEEFNVSKMTTLDSHVMYRYLKRMVDAGITHVVLEITSHALDQQRLSGLHLNGAVVLNVAREHLDYHQTMAEYAAAKEKIITYLKPAAPLVGKADDEYVRAIVAKATAQGIETVTFTSAQARTVVTLLPGTINRENALAATLLSQAIGLPAPAVTAGIAAVTLVPGRMEWVKRAPGPQVLIDYAVTPDALQRLYQDVRSQTSGKVYAVLGAAGLRDRGKRPEMARAVAQLADELVLTREDPWTESEEQIFADLEVGLAQATIPWQRIVDRRAALKYVLQKAQSGDTVVVTGKGAEQGMGIGKKVIPWNDRQVIEELWPECQGH